MVKFNITRADSFKDSFNELPEKEQALVERKIELLSENPSHPSLRTKKMKGKSELFESSVNMDIRILWKFKENKIILLLNIGHHDVLRKY